MNPNRTLAALIVASALSAGCSTGAMKPVHESIARTEAEATDASDHLRKGEPMTPQTEAAIQRINKPWMPVSKLSTPPDAQASVALGRQIAINRRFQSLSEAAYHITALTGIPISASTSGESAGTAAAGPAGSDAQQGVPVIYNGNFNGLLDLIASRYNLYWEWESNRIRFFKTKSRSFRLAALPGDTSLTSKVESQPASRTGSSSGGSGGGDSGGSGKSEIKSGVAFSGLSVWKGVEESIKTMLSKDGRLTVTPATGTITVDDTPVVLERVAKFVEEQNLSLSRQVVINVRVLAVDITNSREYGLNWNAVYQNISKAIGFGVGLATGTPLITGASTLTLGVLPGKVGSSNWSGTDAMIQALEKQGKVSQITSASLVTLNNQPAPIKVGTETAYLAESTTTLGTGGNPNTVTEKAGTVSTGFSMNMLPHILDDTRMMLQYSGEISELRRLDKLETTLSVIQTPEVDTRNFMQRVIMNSGETLVVTGFEQFNMNGATSGVGHPENAAAGGGVTTKDKKIVLVVLIQPVLNNPLQ